MEVWRRRGEAASAGLSAALYSVYHGLYSEAVVSSVAPAVALAEVGRFKEAVQYVQRAAKALYEAAKDVFEHVKIAVQRLVEPFCGGGDAGAGLGRWARGVPLPHGRRRGWGCCGVCRVEPVGSCGAGQACACRRGCAVCGWAGGYWREGG